ncbi:hypothetical protein PAF17_16100 [Paracoccus sp. Z330]|uniref:Uncharacterized protein n=1 Tax=Paracoccus onchidii TaxID=3017813 RepID=A0ABT4ZI60_9RHOB|nr:hypothetical protein [Paracoccus onchidii]MDB6179015.1 hypothetical protein [Paracoccus onchidii]
MSIWWPFGKQRTEIEFQRQMDFAEMENANRELSAKVDRFKAVLEEMTERKRGQNDR